MDIFVDVQWLAERLDDPTLAIVDTRSTPLAIFYGYAGREQYIYGHIPGAVHLDYASQLQDPFTQYAARVAPAERFQEEMGKAGIRDDMTIVAYDAADVPYAARLVWMLHYYGHDDAVILSGGIDAWVQTGHPRISEIAERRMCRFTPSERPRLRASMEEVLDIAEGRSDAQLLSTWPNADFARREREIPRARRLSYSRLFDEIEGTPAPLERVRALLADLDPRKRTIAYSANGVHAAAAYFALRAAGFTDVAVYDGSWAEWSHYNLPTAQYPAAPAG